MLHHLPRGSAIILISISLIVKADTGVTHEVSARGDSAPPLLSEAEIPTDHRTWQGCCSHRDCMEASISVDYRTEEWARVEIGDFPAFDLETRKIYPSNNGKDYFCRRDLSRPPDTRNTRCVFVGGKKQVKGTGGEDRR